MLDELSPAERLLLLKYLCAFAWTDLVVQDAERRFVQRMAKHAALGAEELAQVDAWLDVAPSPGSIDLTAVPKDKRYVFVEAARALMFADGNVDAEERASFERLKAALAAD
jgi:hypothetical protein